MKNIKGFTLFEVILSIILISVIYLFTINNLELNDTKIDKNIDLNNLKKELLSYEYLDSIVVSCIDKNYSCFIIVDGKLQEEKIKNLFSEEPSVYKYNDHFEKLSFEPLELEKLEYQNIIFVYSCDNERKCLEQIVFVDSKGYIFNDIHVRPTLVRSRSEVEDYFQDKIQEVKDAF